MYKPLFLLGLCFPLVASSGLFDFTDKTSSEKELKNLSVEELTSFCDKNNGIACWIAGKKFTAINSENINYSLGEKLFTLVSHMEN